MSDTEINWLDVVLNGRPVVQIGQIPEKQARALDYAAKKGRIRKWRGYWNDPEGRGFGIGPLKTWWGPL